MHHQKTQLTGVDGCIFMMSTALLSATHICLASGPRTEMLGIGIMALSNYLEETSTSKSLQFSWLRAGDGPRYSAPPSHLHGFIGKQTWVRPERGATGVE